MLSHVFPVCGLLVCFFMLTQVSSFITACHGGYNDCQRSTNVDVSSPHLVTSLPGFNETIPFKTYTGYLNTQSAEGSYLFYWFLESQSSPSQDPLVIWLQGGPLCSGLFGLTYEHGYFLINPGGKTLRSNPYSWNQRANMLYIEQPVTTGFSYSERPVKVCNDSQSSEDMNFAFRDFLNQFPQFIGRDTYLADDYYESMKITCENDFFKNVDRGACWKMWTTAFSLIYDPYYIYNSCPNPVGSTPTQFKGSTVTSFLKRFLEHREKTNIPKVEIDTPCVVGSDINAYFNLPEVRSALRVTHGTSTGHGWAYCSGSCIYVQTVTNIMPYYHLLLPFVRILVYNGDVDTVLASVGVQRSLKLLNLTTTTEWKSWLLDNGVNGGNVMKYNSKNGKGLTFATLRGAGHMSPAQKPEAALAMFNRFLAGKCC